MIAYILWFIIVVCILGIGRIIWRHLPTVTIIKTETLVPGPNQIKKKMLADRLERKLVGLGSWSKTAILPEVVDLKKPFKKIVTKIVGLEEQYRRRLFSQKFTTEISKQQAAGGKLQEAQRALAADKIPEAEKILLQVVAIDPHNFGAYRGLGEVYRRQKNYDQAKEVFEFLLKLNDRDPLAYLGLADIAEATGDLLTASKQFHQALDLDTGNVSTYLALAKTYQAMGQMAEAQDILLQALALEPKNVVLLDFLIEISIILQDKAGALSAWERLRETNPDNQKLIELRDQIKELS